MVALMQGRWGSFVILLGFSIGGSMRASIGGVRAKRVTKAAAILAGSHVAPSSSMDLGSLPPTTYIAVCI